MLEKQHKKYIGDILGKDALVRVMTLENAGKSHQDILKFIAKLAHEQPKHKTKSETETVRLSAGDSSEGVVYKHQIVDSDASNTSLPAIESHTPIIEDQSDRLADYARRLGVAPRLHGAFIRFLTPDVLEAIYHRSGAADKKSKALTNTQEIELAFQRARASGIPEILDTGFERVLGSQGYEQFIEQLINLLFWNTAIKPKSVQKSTKSSPQTIRDTFWRSEVTKDKK